ncbi:MAG: hypothetical protein KC416_03035 [Myxococcales bacterium]|nr:hypothetical protein [Myxococcales bacterium]
MKIALVTCRHVPHPDGDLEPLRAALHARGLDAVVAAWDDTSVPWATFDLCLLRSTWNYIHHLDEFIPWTRHVNDVSRLWNPAKIVEWNTDKIYLRTLEARGVPVVPTLFVDRSPPGGSPLADGIAQQVRHRGWTDIVVKPRVSAGSFGTRRFSDPADALSFAMELTTHRDAMIQPYVASVDDYGERSLIWIDGELTHAIRKAPRLAGDQENITGPFPIDERERALALAALGHLTDELLYARIDIAQDTQGLPMLMELELTEPSLYLPYSDNALARLADAVRSYATLPRRNPASRE